MGLCIALTDEAGKKLDFVVDEKNILHALLPAFGDKYNPLLASIDWYGDTVFNGIQMTQFLQEWNSMLSRTTDLESKQLIQAVHDLAERCLSEVHLYLKFFGD